MWAGGVICKHRCQCAHITACAACHSTTFYPGASVELWPCNADSLDVHWSFLVDRGVERPGIRYPVHRIQWKLLVKIECIAAEPVGIFDMVDGLSKKRRCSVRINRKMTL